MATLAGLRQAGLYVIGVSCALIVLEVAGHARSHSQVEVAVYMALRARGGDVHAGQREAGLAVIEGGIGPRSRVVAGGAGGGDSGLRVIGVGCALKILHVAGSTVGWSSGKLSVHVALGTGHGGVGAGQGKLGKGVVIESRRLPRGGGVAALAGLRESRLHMIRVCRLLEIGKMAAYASCGRARELASDVARGAIQGNVRSGERKPGNLQMVKLGAGPGVQAVALFAGGRKTGCHMIWTCGGLILFGMAGVTLGG